MQPAQIGIVPKVFRNLGGKITNEPVKQAIEAIGTAGIAPAAIIFSPGPKTRKAKNEKKYQALRQLPSIVLKYGLAFIVALIVGKKISKASWKSYLPKEMRSKLALKTEKVKSPEALIEALGITNPSAALRARLMELQRTSSRLYQTEAEIKGVHTALEEFIAPAAKNLTSIQAEKSIVKRVDRLMDFSESFADKRPTVAALKTQYKGLKKIAKTAKNQSTVLIRDIREMPELKGKTLEQFDKYIQEYATESFSLYKQMFQAGIALCTLPVSAYLLNLVYPPFVKKVAPGLAKEVEEANR